MFFCSFATCVIGSGTCKILQNIIEISYLNIKNSIFPKMSTITCTHMKMKISFKKHMSSITLIIYSNYRPKRQCLNQIVLLYDGKCHCKHENNTFWQLIAAYPPLKKLFF